MSSLNIPLELAEMLHCVLGPLANVLAEEDHRWAEFLERMLATYRDARDDAIAHTYGPHLVADIDVCTTHVAEKLCKYLDDLAGETEDFELWAKELGNEG